MTEISQNTKKNTSNKNIVVYGLIFISVFLTTFVILRYDFSIQLIQNITKNNQNEMKAYNLFYDYIMHNTSYADEIEPASLKNESVFIVDISRFNTEGYIGTQADYFVIYHIKDEHFSTCFIFLNKPASEQCYD